MSFIISFFSIPMGFIFNICYNLLNSYGWSIVLFTLILKIITMPISIASQINSIKMVKIKPLMDDIREQYSDNPKLYSQELKKLYKKEKYSSFIGILPLLIQIPVILGVISVMYNPIQHIFGVDANSVDLLFAKAAEITGSSVSDVGSQLHLIEIIKSFPDAFSDIVSSDSLNSMLNADLHYMGINLSVFPSLTSLYVLIPLASGLSALLMCVLQNKYNVLQAQQGFLAKWGITVFLVAFSAYFAFVVSSGIGIYWTVNNLFTIAVMFVCNMMYNPKKYIDMENRSQKKIKLTKEQKQKIKQEKAIKKAKIKTDIARFYAAPKKLVFYSESSGFYKYFKHIIEYVLDNSDITVHYVTSDINDKIFENDNPQISAYYVEGNSLIALMMRMDADIVIMTMPDLQKYHIKRSLVRKDVEYVFVDHGMTSLHLGYREGAIDHYDTIFCNGPNQIDEVRAMEKVYGTHEKKVIEAGYGLLDDLLLSVEKMDLKENERKKILIAPSWQKNNVLELCPQELIDPLLSCNCDVIIRPHPEFIKRFPSKMKRITDLYENRENEGIFIEADFSSNDSIYMSDIVITDWSAIAQEFSYATKKPSIFINTPMKIMNPEYKKIPIVPLDISLRDEIGISLDVDKLNTLPALIEELLSKKDEYKNKITDILYKNIFNIGCCGKICVEYIINTIKEKENQKDA